MLIGGYKIGHVLLCSSESDRSCLLNSTEQADINVILKQINERDYLFVTKCKTNPPACHVVGF
ncbi:hypothetical protein D3C74_293790 [compost metagenome]